MRDYYSSAVKWIAASQKRELFKGRNFEGCIILFLSKSVITGKYKTAFSSILDISSIQVEILGLCVDVLKEVLFGVLDPSAYASGKVVNFKAWLAGFGI